MAEEKIMNIKHIYHVRAGHIIFIKIIGVVS